MVLALGVLGAMPLAALAETPIDFPDANFEATVRKTIGKPNGKIYASDVKDVKTLNINGQFISSLAGIEYFTSLDYLSCRYNELSSIDLSKNTKLTMLLCDENFIKTLDVSSLSALRELHCSYNGLTALDVSGLFDLEVLNCYGNNLIALDVSDNTKLISLTCPENNISTLDVSGLPNLKWLGCSDNNLNTLIVSGLSQLESLDCQNNYLDELDVSGLSNLQRLHCNNNNLSELDVSGLSKLQWLYCSNNNLSALDVSGISNLKQFDCSQNIFESLAAVTGHENADFFLFHPQKDFSHIHSYSQKTTAPSCVMRGYTTYFCSCADEYKANYVESLGHSFGAEVTLAATCTTAGSKTKICTRAGCTERVTQTTKSLGHTGGTATCKAKAKCTRCKAEYGSLAAHKSKAVITKATSAKDGKTDTVCSVCNKALKASAVIPKASSIALSTTTYTYDGKEKKPSVTVKDSKNKTLKNGTDYTVTYSSGRKNIGVYNVKITFKGSYSGTVTKTFKINPKATTGVKATKAATSIKLTWTKQSGVEGYQIYDTAQKKVVATVKGADKNSVTISKLTAGKAYNYQVRAYKTVSGTKYYGAYSTALKTSTLPATPKISSVSSPKAKNLTVKWGKVTSATGYLVQYSTDKTFKKGVATKNVSKNATISATYSGLAAGKTYYVRIRTYKTINGAKVYSPYTAAKSVKIK